MSAPRIVVAVQHNLGRILIDEYGERYSYNWLGCGDAVNARLVLSGQRAVWPDRFGVAELVDLPPKLPVSPCHRTLYVGASGMLWVNPSHADDPTGDVHRLSDPETVGRLRVWVDADGVPHVEVVEQGYAHGRISDDSVVEGVSVGSAGCGGHPAANPGPVA